MKKSFIAAAAIVAAVAFTACNNKAAEATEEAVDTVAVEATEVVEEVVDTTAAPADTTVVVEEAVAATPAE